MLTNVLRRSQPGPRTLHPRLTAQLAALLLSVGAIASACAPAATNGTMPPPGADGQVNASLAPDFIAVAARDGGIAGHVPRSYLLPEPTTTTRPPAPQLRIGKGGNEPVRHLRSAQPAAASRRGALLSDKTRLIPPA